MKNWFSGNREARNATPEMVREKSPRLKETKEGRRAVGNLSLNTFFAVALTITPNLMTPNLVKGEASHGSMGGELAHLDGDVRMVSREEFDREGAVPDGEAIHQTFALQNGRLVLRGENEDFRRDPERDDANLELVFFGRLFRGEAGAPAREAVQAGVEDALSPFDLSEGNYNLKIEIGTEDLGNLYGEAIVTMAGIDEDRRMYPELQREIMTGEDVGEDDRVNCRININGQIDWDTSLEGDNDNGTPSLRNVADHEMSHGIGFVVESRVVNNRVDLVNGYPTQYATLLVDDQNRNVLERYDDGSQEMLNALRNDDPGLLGDLIAAYNNGGRIRVDNRNLPEEEGRLSHLMNGLMAASHRPEEHRGGELLDTTSAVILAQCGLRLRVPTVIPPEDIAVNENNSASRVLAFDNLLVRENFEVSATSSDEAVSVELTEEDGVWTLVVTPREGWHGDAVVTIHAAGWQQSNFEANVEVPVHVEAVNDRPEFVDAPREVSGNKGDTLRFNLQGRDADNDHLTFTISNRDGLPEGAVLTDNGDGTASFAWETAGARAGEYDPVFTVSDGRLSRNATVHVEVNNRAPELAEAIADQEREEDCGCVTLVESLNAHFRDADRDSLTYTIQGLAALHLSLDGDTLMMEPDEHFNIAGGTNVTVTATDIDGGQVSEIFRVVITPENDPPRVTNENRESIEVINVNGREGELLEIPLYADDVDLAREGDSLSWRFLERDGLPDEGNDGPRIEYRGGRWYFYWVPGYNHNGTFVPVLEVSDRAGAARTFRINIQIENTNRAPEVVAPIEDVVTDEDSGAREIANLDTVFSDPDNEGNMTYSVSDAPEELGLTLDEQTHVLAINPAENYHTPEGGVRVTVTARDARGEETTQEFTITRNSINDAPTPFDLVEGPENGDTVERDTSLNFSWSPSSDVDGDTLQYELVFSINNGDTTHVFPATGETEFTVNGLQELLHSLGVRDDAENTEVTWSVNVNDGKGITVPSDTRREFNVLRKPTSVNGPETIPTAFNVSNVYPNPVNSHANMNVDLPQSGNAGFFLYDMAGRQVRESSLGEIALGAGTTAVSIDLSHQPAGTYILLVQVPGQGIKKQLIVLVK